MIRRLRLGGIRARGVGCIMSIMIRVLAGNGRGGSECEGECVGACFFRVGIINTVAGAPDWNVCWVPY